MGDLKSKISMSSLPIKVAKREKMSPGIKIGLYVGSLAVSFMMLAIILTTQHVNVSMFMGEMFSAGLFGNKRYYIILENMIEMFVPLLIVSYALSLAFKMKFWNIGGEGQFYIGALAASAVALLLNPETSPFLTIILMVVAGGLSAGIYGVSTAFLKVKFGTNETLLTLMMNYIAIALVGFFALTDKPWNIFQNPTSLRPEFAPLPDNSTMTTIPIGENFELNVSLIIAVAIAVFVFVYLKYTKHGYEISVVGDSPNTARYAGMKVGFVTIRTVFMSAAMIGVAASMTISSSGRMGNSISNNVGWDGIIVAWLAKLNPIAIFVIAFLMTYLEMGCAFAKSSFAQIDGNFVDILQGIILFLVLASDFFINYKIVRVRKVKAVQDDQNGQIESADTHMHDALSQEIEIQPCVDTVDSEIENESQNAVEDQVMDVQSKEVCNE